MRNLLLAGLFALAAPLAAVAADLTPGQTLACASATPSRRLFAVVGRIEPYGSGTAVGISLYDKTPGSRLPVTAHLPIDLAALSASCTAQTAVTLPIDAHFEAGYADWRAAVVAQEAGVFTLSPDQIEDMLMKQLPPPAGSAQ